MNLDNYSQDIEGTTIVHLRKQHEQSEPCFCWNCGVQILSGYFCKRCGKDDTNENY